MDALLIIFFIANTLYVMVTLAEHNSRSRGWDLSNIIQQVSVWMSINLCALVIGATIIGKGPVVTYDFKTIAGTTTQSITSAETIISINGKEVPVVQHETQYDTNIRCKIEITLDYRLMMWIDKETTVVVDGSCSQLDDLNTIPMVKSVLDGWEIV